MLPILATLNPGELKMVPNSILEQARTPDGRKVLEWMCNQTTGADKLWPATGGAVKQRSIMLAESGAVIALFPDGSLWMLFTGGGHADGAYSGVVGYCIHGPEEGQWRTKISHPEFFQGAPNYGLSNGTYPLNPDGSPGSIHTWGGLLWYPAPYYKLRRTMGSFWFSGGPDPNRRVWLGDPVTGTWSQHAVPWFAATKPVMFGCHFDAPNKEIWHWEHQIRQRDCDTGQDIQLNKPTTAPLYESFANSSISVFDSANRILYLLESITGPAMRMLDLKLPPRLCTKLTVTGDTTALATQRHGAQFRNGKIYQWVGGNSLYVGTLTGTTCNFVKETLAGDSGPPFVTQGMFGKFSFIDDERFILATEVFRNLYVGRIAGGSQPPVDTQAPAAPTLTLQPATWS